MANTVDKVIDIAKKEIGYLEKKSNAKLDSKIDNAGYNNYTKYWRDLNASGYQGQPWCNCWINWIFVKAYGEKKAKELLCTSGGWSYYTPTSSDYFKNKKQWYTSNPKVGDIIYFKDSRGTICHVGIVYKINAGYVYTYEGNTSAGNGVISNGGGVASKQYSITYSRIAGYGRPKYDKTTISSTITTTKPSVSTTTAKYTTTDFIKDLQKAVGIKVTGKYDNELLKKLPLIKTNLNSKHKVVKPLQKRLNALGYNCGDADGEYGTNSKSGAKKFQAANKLVSDGEVGSKTWTALLK